jgi:galactosamine-6-phosphate isomerase
MNINYFANTDEISQKAADIVVKEVKGNRELLICAATGSSPKRLYQILAMEQQKNTTLFEKAQVIPLDEWIGLPTEEGSCHAYINEHILEPLHIDEERYFKFNGAAIDLDKECKRIKSLLEIKKHIDLLILGLGKNGHLGFNEPAAELQLHCHVADLSKQSQEHSMIEGAFEKPTKGLTLGMQDILNAKKIILIVSGDSKEVATNQLLSGKITNECPASWLWKHNNVDCLILN